MIIWITVCLPLLSDSDRKLNHELQSLTFHTIRLVRNFVKGCQFNFFSSSSCLSEKRQTLSSLRFFQQPVVTWSSQFAIWYLSKISKTFLVIVDTRTFLEVSKDFLTSQPNDRKETRNQSLEYERNEKNVVITKRCEDSIQCHCRKKKWMNYLSKNGIQKYLKRASFTSVMYV